MNHIHTIDYVPCLPSCPLVDTDRLDVVFNVLDLPACPGEGHMYSRKGVCTGWLDDLTQGLQGEGAGEAGLQVSRVAIFCLIVCIKT